MVLTRPLLHHFDPIEQHTREKMHQIKEATQMVYQTLMKGAMPL